MAANLNSSGTEGHSRSPHRVGLIRAMAPIKIIANENFLPFLSYH